MAGLECEKERFRAGGADSEDMMSTRYGWI